MNIFGQTEKVVFSAPGGFYETSFSLSLECLSALHHVRYTTNGASPNTTSRLYEQPLWLDKSLYSHSDIYTIQTGPENILYLPDSVQHCIVIRAAVFNENDSCISAITTQSYLIRDLDNIDTQLPMLSICADSLDLFDYEQKRKTLQPVYPLTAGLKQGHIRAIVNVALDRALPLLSEVLPLFFRKEQK